MITPVTRFKIFAQNVVTLWRSIEVTHLLILLFPELDAMLYGHVIK